MNNVFLVEDHDDVLKIWRKQNIKGIDLVHLDAHIDFGFYSANPIEKVIKEAKSVEDLKRKLEHSLNFLHYEKDFNKQANIGNYIYPAMEEGMVNNFYWVVPGRPEEFKKSRKTIKNILKEIIRFQSGKNDILNKENGAISTRCLGRNFIICTLDNLPVITGDIILDIDTDFLIIDSVLNAENTKNIGKRKPWILPKELTDIVKEKIKAPKIITIAYSVNGGFTPIKYKHLGDELAYNFSHSKFKKRFKINQRAARYFDLFNSTGRQEYYKRAVRLNPAYRVTDNNYGPLYLFLRKFSPAQKEFSRILTADKQNPGAHLGLGTIALERKEFKKARRHLYSALHFVDNQRFFSPTKKQVLFALGKAEFHLRNFHKAKELLLSYKNSLPLEPQSHYLLGCILEKEKEFSRAAAFYKNTFRLGMAKTEPLFKLLRISAHLEEKDDIIKYVIAKYKLFKKELIRLNQLQLKKKKISGLTGFKKKFLALEKKIHTMV